MRGGQNPEAARAQQGGRGKIRDHPTSLAGQRGERAFQIVALRSLAQIAVWLEHDHVVHLEQRHEVTPIVPGLVARRCESMGETDDALETLPRRDRRDESKDRRLTAEPKGKSALGR